MKIWTSLVVATTSTSIVNAAAVPLSKRNHQIEVTLTQHNDVVIKACLTNTGDATIRLLNKGTILDDAPTEKVSVHSKEDGPLNFLGIRKRIKTEQLTEDAFTSLDAGESVDVHVNVAAFHDLSPGGMYHVLSEGSIPYLTEASNSLGPSLLYRSNGLDIAVNGTKAAEVRKLHAPAKRSGGTTLDADCSGDQKAKVSAALPECSLLAKKASEAALTVADAKFKEYFRIVDDFTRNNVSQRYAAVAAECSKTDAGITQLHCQDLFQACDGNTLSYTVPSDNLIINCPEYYTFLPVLASACHGQDMTTTTLHEMTHAPGVFFPGTQDLAYGFDGIKTLKPEQGFLNADTYALFANAVYLRC